MPHPTQETLKTYKKALKQLGFRTITPNSYYYDNNGLYYIVSFKADGNGSQKIGLEAGHAALYPDGKPRARHSPVGGWIGFMGVGNFIYFERAHDASFYQQATREYFTYFKTAADYRTALTTLEERLDGDYSAYLPPDGAGGMDVPWFTNRTANELQTEATFDHAIAAYLTQNTAYTRTDDRLYIRKRGEIYDCIMLCYDELSTFTRIKTYPWHDALCSEHWSTYSEFIEHYLPDNTWARTADLLADPARLDSLVAQATRFTAQFHNLQDYLAYMDEHGNWVAENYREHIHACVRKYTS